MGHAHQHHQAGAGKAADRGAVHLDAGLARSLDHSSHEKEFCLP
jgi:hypothetical protein